MVRATGHPFKFHSVLKCFVNSFNYGVDFALVSDCVFVFCARCVKVSLTRCSVVVLVAGVFSNVGSPVVNTVISQVNTSGGNRGFGR